MIYGIDSVKKAVEFGKGLMSQASGGPDTPQRNGKNAPDLLRAMHVKVPVSTLEVKAKGEMHVYLNEIVKQVHLVRLAFRP